MYIARCRYALTSAYSDDDIDAIASHGEEEEIQEEEAGEEGEEESGGERDERGVRARERETRETRVRQGSAHSFPPHACAPLSPLSSISSVPPGPDVGDGGGQGSRSGGGGGGGGGFEFAEGGVPGWGLGARVWIGEGVRGTKVGQMRLRRQVARSLFGVFFLFSSSKKQNSPELDRLKLDRLKVLNA